MALQDAQVGPGGGSPPFASRRMKAKRKPGDEKHKIRLQRNSSCILQRRDGGLWSPRRDLILEIRAATIILLSLADSANC